MYKIFYDPKTLKIKGSSDGEDSMTFPYVETEEYYHSLKGLNVEKDKKGKVKLKVLEGTLAIPPEMLIDPVIEEIKPEIIPKKVDVEEEPE